MQCTGDAGGVYIGNGHIVGMIRDGDSVATLMRMADEHRPQCAWEAPVVEGEAEEPAWKPAEALIQSGGRTFALLRRLDCNVWDAWLRPEVPVGEAAWTRVTRNGVSYEMAFFAVYRAMGVALPAEFAAVYAGEQPDPTPYPKPFVPTPELWAQPESRLPVSYERHMVRFPRGHGMWLHESGQVEASTAGTETRWAASGTPG